MALRPTVRVAAATGFLFLLCACDNVGRAFDRGGRGRSPEATTIATPSVGGTWFDGRPRVRAVFPKGSGWAPTAPVVIVFNEAIHEELAVPEQGDPLVFCRVKGATQRVPVSYHFLQGGNVLLIRPVPSWPAAQQQGAAPEIEVVVDPQLRDTDGIRLGSGGDPLVVGTFIPDADVQAEPDGRIVTTIPEDSARDVPREVPIYLVFDRPATANSVTTANFRIDAGGNQLPGVVSTPIAEAGVTDTRIVRLDPDDRLPGDAEVRITVDDTIRFANNGVLDFLGRSPFARFRTLPFASADGVALAAPQPGFPNKINRGNVQSAQLEVTLPADSRAGDEVVARVYGLERRTEAPDDVNFIEARQTIPADGTTLLVIPLDGKLGTVDEPRFADGPATFVVRVRRSSRTTGWVTSGPTAEPRIDVTPPRLDAIGPPNLGDQSLDLITDQEFVVVHGTANERIAAATVAVLGQTATHFGTATTGQFMTNPLPLGRVTGPVPYTVTLTDAAGNEGQPISGTIIQRGTITGTQTGTLVVEAYDEATLRAIPNALVVIEPGMPQKPAVGQMTLATGDDGRAMFSGLAAPEWSITVVAPGYHIKSLLATPAAFVSLGLRPLQGATATLQGAVLPASGISGSVRVGCNVFDDAQLDGVVPGGQLLIPATPIRPNRLVLTSAFVGSFDAVGNGTFAASAVSMAGPNGITPTPAAPPAAPGATVGTSLPLVAAQGVVNTAPYNRDFAASTGLGTIESGPTVRVMMSLLGVSGNVLFGTGTATMTGGPTSFDVVSSYSLVHVTTLAPLSPVL